MSSSDDTAQAKAKVTSPRSAAKCRGCDAPFGLFRGKCLCVQAEGGCGGAFCSTCLNYACVTEKEAASQSVAGKVSNFCKPCFQKNSSLDFTVKSEVLGPEKGSAPSVVLVHGGGGCRKMFVSLARKLAENNYRAVLIDLPGHGSRMDEKLSMDSAIQTILEALTTQAGDWNGRKPMLVGGSLGGYIGMELLGKHPDSVSGAVIAVCGQNVGKDRGVAASLGLWGMDWICPKMGAKQLLTGLLAQTKKAGAKIPAEDLLETCLRTGMFFNQAHEQIEILRATSSAEALSKFEGPIWFVNGSKDHRDSEHKWVKASKNATLTVYEGADHFLSHDERFACRFQDEVLAFTKEKVYGIETADVKPTVGT
ncbi:TPA: hypothetical protein N0F65_010412 [Lagenidium giganteum]|uniref:FYVE zinc finger domain-containing protein n=1 Tax=Lagenidium giganteum TaxID=4803 RepID=A0AAV2YQN2_9STRA|nr:TPA: hypothetical protein N0F65_010412 [Lagenidium giganteum]